MRSHGTRGSIGLVMVAVVALAAACATSSPPVPVVPDDTAVHPVVSPPVVNPQPVQPVSPVAVEPESPKDVPTVPLEAHQKVVAELTEVRTRLAKLQSANARLTNANKTLAEEVKKLQADLAAAKTEAEQLNKKLSALLSPPGPTETTEPPATTVEEYVVQPGDSFEAIAAKTEVYGNPERWKDLFEANKERLGLSKPEDLRVGMKLEIKRP